MPAGAARRGGGGGGRAARALPPPPVRTAARGGAPSGAPHGGTVRTTDKPPARAVRRSTRRLSSSNVKRFDFKFTHGKVTHTLVFERSLHSRDQPEARPGGRRDAPAAGPTTRTRFLNSFWDCWLVGRLVLHHRFFDGGIGVGSRCPVARVARVRRKRRGRGAAAPRLSPRISISGVGARKAARAEFRGAENICEGRSAKRRARRGAARRTRGAARRGARGGAGG